MERLKEFECEVGFWDRTSVDDPQRKATDHSPVYSRPTRRAISTSFKELIFFSTVMMNLSRTRGELPPCSSTSTHFSNSSI